MRPQASCEPYGGGRATRSADGVSPSGVSTADDRRRLAVRPIIDHDSPKHTAAVGCSVRDHAEAMHVGFTDHGLEAHATFGLSPTARDFTDAPASKLRALRLSGFSQSGSRRTCAVSRTPPQQVASPTAERFFAAVPAVLVGVAVWWGSVCLAPRSFRSPCHGRSGRHDAAGCGVAYIGNHGALGGRNGVRNLFWLIIVYASPGRTAAKGCRTFGRSPGSAACRLCRSWALRLRSGSATGSPCDVWAASLVAHRGLLRLSGFTKSGSRRRRTLE